MIEDADVVVVLTGKVVVMFIIDDAFVVDNVTLGIFVVVFPCPTTTKIVLYTTIMKIKYFSIIFDTPKKIFSFQNECVFSWSFNVCR